MLIRELAVEIESPKFSAKMNLASGRNLFMRLLDADSLISSLISLMKENSESVIEVLSRVEQLSRLSVNPKYENPNDVQIAVYCWALFKFSQDIGRIASTFAASARGTWWADEIASFILESNVVSQKNALFVTQDTKFDGDHIAIIKSLPQYGIKTLPTPLTLVNDVGRYRLSSIFKNEAKNSDKPNASIFEWAEYKQKYTFHFLQASLKGIDTPIAVNWS